MSDDLFGRICKLSIATPVATPGDYSGTTSQVIEINAGVGVNALDPNDLGMRVQFEIARSDQKEPNTSQIVITNLSDTRRASLNKKPVKYTLDAGYVDTGLTRIFRGDMRTTDHIRAEGDWNTTVKLGDGERSYRFARVSESFAKGVGAGTILQYLAGQSGLSIGNVPFVVADLTTTFDYGYVVSGSWKQAMDTLVRSIGYTWSIQDETLQVLLPNQALDAQIPLISPETGLIGSPEMGTPEKKGKPTLVKFTSLLRPARPGCKVHLRSKRYDADVRVKKCRFVGDSHGGDWYTHFEGVVLGQ